MKNSIHEIEAKEAELRSAMMDGDPKRLDTLLQADLIFTVPDGSLMTKEGDLEAHRQGLIKISRLDFSERQTRVWNDSVAVVVTAEMEGKFKGQDFKGRFRYTRLWRRDEGFWRVALGHCSQLG